MENQIEKLLIGAGSIPLSLLFSLMAYKEFFLKSPTSLFLFIRGVGGSVLLITAIVFSITNSHAVYTMSRIEAGEEGFEFFPATIFAGLIAFIILLCLKYFTIDLRKGRGENAGMSTHDPHCENHSNKDPKEPLRLTVFSVLMSLHFALEGYLSAEPHELLGSLSSFGSAILRQLAVSALFGVLFNSRKATHTLPLISLACIGVSVEAGTLVRILAGEIDWLIISFVMGTLGGVLAYIAIIEIFSELMHMKKRKLVKYAGILVGAGLSITAYIIQYQVLGHSIMNEDFEGSHHDHDH